MLPSDQIRIIYQPKFTYSPLGKAFVKQGKKQVDPLKLLKPNIQKLSIKDAIPEKHLVKKLKMNLIKLKT